MVSEDEENERLALVAALLPEPIEFHRATSALTPNGSRRWMLLRASASIVFFLRTILLRVAQAHLHYNKDEDHCHATS